MKYKYFTAFLNDLAILKNEKSNIFSYITNGYKLGEFRNREISEGILSQLRIPERVYNLQLNELSGGELKRVILARIICLDPQDILIFHNPLEFMDVYLINSFLSAIKRYNGIVIFFGNINKDLEDILNFKLDQNGVMKFTHDKPTAHISKQKKRTFGGSGLSGKIRDKNVKRWNT